MHVLYIHGLLNTLWVGKKETLNSPLNDTARSISRRLFATKITRVEKNVTMFIKNSGLVVALPKSAGEWLAASVGLWLLVRIS